LGFAAWQGRAEPETYLIPTGYVGTITIAFNAANGRPLAREGDARLYQIPENGILLSQAAPNTGLSPIWKFFAVAANAERSPITRIWASTVPDTPENRANGSVEIFYPVRGRLQAGRIPCDVEYDQYFVGTRAQLLDHDVAIDRRHVREFLEKNFVCQ
jgi:hypothetical protein